MKSPFRDRSLPRRHDWLRIGFVLLLWAWSLVIGCTSSIDPPQLSSLRRSGKATFICVGPGKRGTALENCPQGPHLDDGGLMVGRQGYDLHSLVTQTASAEVAVVRLTGIDDDGTSNGRVLDADSTNPGVTPLRVGQQPVDIVTTPGGLASFVGVAEPGREGIFALATSCIFEPEAGETKRDLTTWPACSLPSAPGEMVILVDPANSAGQVRTSCDGTYQDAATLVGLSGQGECSADLATEITQPGRRKLVVGLPDQGKLVVIDAQELLGRPQGSYEPCIFEQVLPLENSVPARISQPLPADLVVAGCTEPTKQYGPFPGPFSARPSGMDQRDDLLLVGDQGSPLIHRIDTHEPCALAELEPLVATSITQPSRVVTTSRVSISPITPDGKQYAYAIDEVGERVASVMIFDLSPGQLNNTPLVRAGAPKMLLEPADRIEFAAPAKDVAFALVDRPEVDPITGTAAFGVRCDPDPAIDPLSPPARHRPNLDDETGAQPYFFRGLFGYVLLGNGNLALIDVDDFDAECRRPTQANASSTADLHGCAADPKKPAYYTLSGSSGDSPTVTDEVSCRVVEPHRARAGTFLLTSEDSTSFVPSLNAMPRLSRLGLGVAVNRQVPAGRESPIMLGVDFPGPRGNVPAQVYVGNILFERGDTTNPLIISPKLAEQSSMVLPLDEPRAYPASENVTVSYEGDLNNTQPTGLFDAANAAILDAQARYCDMGVQSQAQTAELGRQRFGLEGDLAERFGKHHADYVQLVNGLPTADDEYWQKGGKVCADLSRDPDVDSFTACDTLFGDGVITTATTSQTTTTTTSTNRTSVGSTTLPGSTGAFPGSSQPVSSTTTTKSTVTTYTTTTGDDLSSTRDFRILEAYQDHVLIEPRTATGAEAREIMDLMQCCFPGVLSYKVRAGHQWVVRGDQTGFRHSVKGVPVTIDGQTQYQCVSDCDPRRGTEQGRVFEISSTDCPNPDPNASNFCAVGPRTDDDLVCAYDAASGRPVSPGSVASECIHEGPTRRFAIYRGLAPSTRGMIFATTVTGGFTALTVPLIDTVNNNKNVLPVSLTPVTTFGQLAVVDSQSRGLMMIDLQAAYMARSFF